MRVFGPCASGFMYRMQQQHTQCTTEAASASALSAGCRGWPFQGQRWIEREFLRRGQCLSCCYGWGSAHLAVLPCRCCLNCQRPCQLWALCLASLLRAPMEAHHCEIGLSFGSGQLFKASYRAGLDWRASLGAGCLDLCVCEGCTTRRLRLALALRCCEHDLRHERPEADKMPENRPGGKASGGPLEVLGMGRVGQRPNF